MFLRDGLSLYDLAETSRRLMTGPGWLSRRARAGALPAAWVDGRLGFAAPWVDAAAGVRPDDPDTVAAWWRSRLAPPPTDAHRASADRADLPLADSDLLDAGEAARRLRASARALERLASSGTLPGLTVDGRTRYDARLVDLLAEIAAGTSLTPADLETRAARRRAEIEPLGRFSWRGRERAPTEVGAWQPPADLGLDAIEPLAPPRPRIADAGGFETIEED